MDRCQFVKIVRRCPRIIWETVSRLCLAAAQVSCLPELLPLLRELLNLRLLYDRWSNTLSSELSPSVLLSGDVE
jgi:hypothetical protein